MTWETGASLVEYGLRRANELGVSVTGEGDFEKDYRDYINLAYWDIIGEFPWLWAQKYPPFMFTTEAPIRTTGTALSDHTIQSGTVPAIDYAGYKLVFDHDGIVMRVASSAGVSFNISAVIPRWQSLSGPMTIFKDEYVMPSDMAIPLRLQSLHTGGALELLPQDLFMSQYGNNAPHFAPVSYTYVAGQRIQLGGLPEEQEMFELQYTYIPPALDFSGSFATDVPIVPIHIRWTIADRALFYLLTDMDDNKATLAVANSSERLKEEKNRQSVRMAPQWWIPRRFRLARGRF